jgi:hypothetical protein
MIDLKNLRDACYRSDLIDSNVVMTLIWEIEDLREAIFFKNKELKKLKKRQNPPKKKKAGT